jgi:hypothetical protein
LILRPSKQVYVNLYSSQTFSILDKRLPLD